jgi:SAM-dependent methyltransferase
MRPSEHPPAEANAPGPLAETVPCPVCRKTNTRLARRHGSCDLRVCRDCGVRFAHPMEHPGQQWYEESPIYEEVRWNVPSVSQLADRWEFAEALTAVKRKSGTWLDVGCGRGDFLKVAESRGFKVTGLDLNQILICVARETYRLTDVHVDTMESFASVYPERRFDVVSAFEVLEHLPSPHDFIDTCLSRLSKDGHLVISVPGFERRPAWVNNEVDLPPHHLVLWSETGLRTLFEKHGLTNVQIFRKPLLLGDLTYHAVRWLPGLLAPGLLRACSGAACGAS